MFKRNCFRAISDGIIINKSIKNLEKCLLEIEIIYFGYDNNNTKKDKYVEMQIAMYTSKIKNCLHVKLIPFQSLTINLINYDKNFIKYLKNKVNNEEEENNEDDEYDKNIDIKIDNSEKLSLEKIFKFDSITYWYNKEYLTSKYFNKKKLNELLYDRFK